MLRLPALLTTTAALLALPAAAQAGYFAGDVIDGPLAGNVRVGDVDIARDGTGAVAYVKDDGGVPHVFVSRLIGGAFQAPERVDPALPGAASQPSVAASDGGRVVVAFRSGTQVDVALKPDASTPFLPPQALADGASDPSIDMSINGVSYVSFTAPGASAADVRVARLARKATGFGLLSDPLDIVPAQDAGTGTGRSRTAVSAEGTAVVLWGEAGHVYSRRVFGTRISTAPQDLNVPSLDGHAGGAADLPSISIEDDASYAWAVIRQAFDDGHTHTVARRLRGSVYEAGSFVDGLGYPAPASSSEIAIALSGRGEGIAATSAGGGVNTALIHRDAFFPAVPALPAAATSLPAVGIAENGDAYAAALSPDGGVRLTGFDISPSKAGVPAPGPAQVLSPPQFGAADPAGGMELGVNRAGDAWAVFVQNGADGKRIVAGGFDRGPGQFRTYTSSKYRRSRQPKLTWQSAFELQGALTYSVEIDGQAVGQTNDRFLTPGAPIADGVHPWRVVATDRRGQTATANVRQLRIDGTPPAFTSRLTGTRKVARKLTLKVKATDQAAPPVNPDGTPVTPRPAPVNGSGISRYRIDWGDRTKADTKTTASHGYRRNGTFTIRVSVTDRAGNATVTKQRVTVKK